MADQDYDPKFKTGTEVLQGLFENGKAFLAGRFPELEAQLGGMTPGGGYQGEGGSPDRADACVWALWALLLKPKAPEPRIRSFDDSRPHRP